MVAITTLVAPSGEMLSGRGSAPDPIVEAYNTPSDTTARLREPTPKGKGERGEAGEKVRKG